jgi:hypothetical protein
MSDLGKAAGKGGWREPRNKMSKDDDEDKFHKRKTHK